MLSYSHFPPNPCSDTPVQAKTQHLPSCLSAQPRQMHLPNHPCPRFPCSNTHIEEEINRLRAELLRKDQDNERMTLALAAEKEERERAQARAWLVLLPGACKSLRWR